LTKRGKVPTEPFLKALYHAGLAGGLRMHARRDERLVKGFTRAAALQSERSEAALNDWVATFLKGAGGA
jgi:hypothetical protein